jgi:hypothetical protein
MSHGIEHSQDAAHVHKVVRLVVVAEQLTWRKRKKKNNNVKGEDTGKFEE